MNSTKSSIKPRHYNFYMVTCLLLLFLMMTAYTHTAFSGTQELKVTAKLDKATSDHANKLAMLFSKVRTAYLNYDIKFILANTSTPKAMKIPPRETLAKMAKRFIPEIFKLTLVKVERKGNVTGLWMLPLKQTGKSKIAYLFRFIKDDKGHWRNHAQAFAINESDDQKKSAMDLLNALKL